MPRATWTWTFDLPPAELWPVLADTNRFNEAMGLPPYVLEETPQPNGTILRRGKGKAAGFELEWEEKPYEWIRGRHFRQARVFTKGPFRRFGPVFDLEPVDLGGRRRRLAGELRPRMGAAHPGRPPVRRAAGAPGRRGRGQAHPRSRRLRQGRARHAFRPAAARAARRRARARRVRSPPRSIAAPTATASAGRSPSWCSPAWRPISSHLKPKQLARELNVPPRAAIEACLAATRAGLLAMKWDLLCTNCRGAKFSTPTLERAAARRALPVLQHRLRPRLREERRALLRARAGGAAAARPAASASPARWRRRTSPSSSCWRRARRAPSAPTCRPGSYRLRTLHPGALVDVEHAGGAFPGLRVTAAGVEALPPGEKGDASPSSTTPASSSPP